MSRFNIFAPFPPVFAVFAVTISIAGAAYHIGEAWNLSGRLLRAGPERIVHPKFVREVVEELKTSCGDCVTVDFDCLDNLWNKRAVAEYILPLLLDPGASVSLSADHCPSMLRDIDKPGEELKN